MDPNGIDEAVLSAAARHALHDEELVAALVDEALEPADDARARGLVGRCGACRDLHADVVATVAAHRASAAMTSAAPRDFRLTEADARRLRPDLPVLRQPVVTAAVTAAVRASPAADAPTTPFLARVRNALRSAVRPLGGALVTAGLVGVLIGAVGFAGIPAAAQLPVGGDRQEVTAPGATGSTAASYDGGAKDQSAVSGTIDPRVVILVVSLASGLTGLVILASTRRRARETI
jgi:hypothetical protein